MHKSKPILKKLATHLPAISWRVHTFKSHPVRAATTRDLPDLLVEFDFSAYVRIRMYIRFIRIPIYLYWQEGPATFLIVAST